MDFAFFTFGFLTVFFLTTLAFLTFGFALVFTTLDFANFLGFFLVTFLVLALAFFGLIFVTMWRHQNYVYIKLTIHVFFLKHSHVMYWVTMRV